MIGNDEVKEGLVSYLKGKATVTALLAAATAIKEAQWQGTTFVYPAMRVSIDKQVPLYSCDLSRVTFSIQCFSEDASSQEADNLAGEVNEVLHNKNFTSNSIQYLVYSTGLIGAIRQDERTWRSEATFQAIINQ